MCLAIKSFSHDLLVGARVYSARVMVDSKDSASQMEDLFGLVVVFFGFFSRCYVDLYSIGLQRSLLYLLRSDASAFAEKL